MVPGIKGIHQNSEKELGENWEGETMTQWGAETTRVKEA